MKIYLLIFLLGFKTVFAQNLVTNPSFEQYTKCVEYYGDLIKSVGWSKGHYAASPDYFNRCYNPVSKYTEIYFGVPLNFEGTREPVTGNAYAGLALFFYDRYLDREYVKNKLQSKLQAGKKYKASFFVSLSDSSELISDHISFAFTVEPTKKNKGQISFIDPMTSIIICATNIKIVAPEKLNKKSWVKIEAEYTAIGGEEYLIIGSFMDDMTKSEFKKLMKKPLFKIKDKRNACAYYYLDDVYVELLKE